MRVITPLDLRRSLGRILDEASAGQRFVIERDRRPLAVLMSVEDGRRLEDDADTRLLRTRAALDRLAAIGDELAANGVRLGDPPSLVRADRDRDDQATP
jgi:prevent-host-death family protein